MKSGCVGETVVRCGHRLTSQSSRKKAGFWGTFGLFTDITERRKAESDRQRLLEEIGAERIRLRLALLSGTPRYMAPGHHDRGIPGCLLRLPRQLRPIS